MAVADPQEPAPGEEHQRFAHLEFCPVLDATGADLGTLEQLYLDADSGAPAWAQVVGGYAHMRRMLVPMEGARVPDVTKQGQDCAQTEPLQVTVTRQQAVVAPILDATDGLSAAEDAQLREHYGLAARSRRGDAADNS